MDLVLKLREVRQRARLTQSEAATKAGVGAKTISSFESGARIDSLKVRQLEQLLAAYGSSVGEFFSAAFEHSIAPWDSDPDETLISTVAGRLRSLPHSHRLAIAEKVLAMLDGVVAILPPPPRPSDRPSASIH